MKLSDNLKRIRKENNLSQEELAEKLGVSRQAVSKWELDQSYPEMEKVLLICKLFDYNVDELMNGDVKEIEETKAAKVNLNKFIDGFFEFITKIINMLEHMTFIGKIKFIFEQVIVGLILFVIFLLIGTILGEIISIDAWKSNVFIAIKTLLTAIYQIISFALGIAIFLHIFKIRYLDYYEIVRDIEDEDSKPEVQKQGGKESKRIIIEKVQETEKGFFSKASSMLKSMEGKEKVKCILEQIVIFALVVVVFMFCTIIILPTLFNVWIEAEIVLIWFIVALITAMFITKYVFEKRYLKYYNISEEEINKGNEKIVDAGRKIVFEKKKEKIIIRDPSHSESKFLKALLEAIINIIKIFAAAIAGFFAFTFVGLVVLFVVSFMIVKSGFVFFGTLFCMISALVINFIVLYLLYNFITSRKLKKNIIAIIFLISLVICGVGIGFICIGVTDFNYAQERTEIETYNVEGVNKVAIERRYKIEYEEIDSNEIKVEIVRSKYEKAGVIWSNNVFTDVYFYEDESKTMDKIRDMIEDINNKEFRDYYVTPKIKIYASRERIENMKEN